MKLNSTDRNMIRVITVVIIILCILTRLCTSGYEDSEAAQEQKRRMEAFNQLKIEQEEYKKNMRMRLDAMRGPSPM